MVTAKQIRVTPIVDKLVTKLTKALKKTNPLVKTRQDTITLAVTELADRELGDKS